MPGRRVARAAPQDAFTSALRRLARRDHSEAELRRALRRAGHAPESIDAALARLRSRGLVDDAGFARRFAASRLAHHGLGSRRIDAALRERGVARRVAQDGVTAALAEVDEGEMLTRLARRYWQRRAGDAPERRLQRTWLFLVRRGFPPALVAERLRALWPRWRDALDGLPPLDEESS
jgi:regulatory protein